MYTHIHTLIHKYTHVCVCKRASQNLMFQGTIERKKVKLFSHVQLFVTLPTAAPHAPLSMGFSRQEYWSGLTCPPPGDPPNPGIKPMPLISPGMGRRFFTTVTT